jgi:hypothetical protein
MARRITAALAIVALIWVLLLLLWTVERHREQTVGADQPASVALSFRSTSNPLIQGTEECASCWHGCCCV